MTVTKFSKGKYKRRKLRKLYRESYTIEALFIVSFVVAFGYNTKIITPYALVVMGLAIFSVIFYKTITYLKKKRKCRNLSQK